MDEKLPIKFFSKREEDNQRVEGGGSKTLPKWVLTGDELHERSIKLSNSIDNIIENENWNNRIVPIIVQAKLNKEALAKSHRKKIENIFSTTKNNILGISEEDTLIIHVDSKDDGVKIKKNILDLEKNFYGISGVEDITKYTPIIEKNDNQLTVFFIKK